MSETFAAYSARRKQVEDERLLVIDEANDRLYGVWGGPHKRPGTAEVEATYAWVRAQGCGTSYGHCSVSEGLRLRVKRLLVCKTMGFAPASQSDWTDKPTHEVDYLSRAYQPHGPGAKTAAQHQYLSLSYYTVRPHYEPVGFHLVVYAAPFVARSKAKQVRLHCSGGPDWDGALAAVSLLYPLPKDES